MNKARIRASAFAMSYLSNAERVREAVESLGLGRAKEPPYVSSAGVKLTAVRLRLRRYHKLREYIGDINGYVAEAAAAGSQLVAFPELSGMLPLSLMPWFPAILEDLKGLSGASQQEQAEAFSLLCESTQGFVGEIFHNTLSRLALSHGIAIAAGSVYQMDAGRIYNRQYLFSESGEVCGIQNKIFLSPLERQLGVVPGNQLTPAQTRFGRIALLSSCDTAQYEPFAVASAAGCTIAVAGASPYAGFDCDCARYRAQENMICVVSPGLGDGAELGLSVDAPCALYAPRAATRSRDGIIGQSRDGKTLTARVDLSRAALQFDLYTADRNPDFFRTLLNDSQK